MGPIIRLTDEWFCSIVNTFMRYLRVLKIAQLQSTFSAML